MCTQPDCPGTGRRVAASDPDWEHLHPLSLADICPQAVEPQMRPGHRQRVQTLHLWALEPLSPQGRPSTRTQGCGRTPCTLPRPGPSTHLATATLPWARTSHTGSTGLTCLPPWHEQGGREMASPGELGPGLSAAVSPGPEASHPDLRGSAFQQQLLPATSPPCTEPGAGSLGLDA